MAQATGLTGCLAEPDRQLREVVEITAPARPVREGYASSERLLRFPVTRNGPRAALDLPITVTYRTSASVQGRSAEIGADYQEVAEGQLQISSGERSGFIEIPVVGDRFSEPDEFVDVILTGPEDLLEASRARATGMIRDDDRGPDFNRDGYGDLLVGAPEQGAGPLRGIGAAKIYFGGPGAMPGETPPILLNGTAENAHVGTAVAAGDIDGDGYDDIVASEFRKDSASGQVYVFYGRESLLRRQSVDGADITIEPVDTGDSFGNSLAVADINDDGHGDLLIAAKLNRSHVRIPTNGIDGEIYVFFGGPRQGSAQRRLKARDADLVIYSDQPLTDGAQLGIEVFNAGDVNGDGIEDAATQLVVEGASRTLVVLGRPTPHWNAWQIPGHPPLTSGQLLMSSTRADLSFAAESYAASTGQVDLNGDGLDDILLADYYVANDARHCPDLAAEATPGRGRVLIYFGRPHRPGDPLRELAQPDRTIYNCRAPHPLGFSIAGLGDIDGDRLDDFAVGNPRAGEQGGQVLVFRGRPGGVPARLEENDASFRIDGAPQRRLGLLVAGRLDYNGDARHDLLSVGIVDAMERLFGLLGSEALGALSGPLSSEAGPGVASWEVQPVPAMENSEAPPAATRVAH
jgi:hypothetical protein